MKNAKLILLLTGLAFVACLSTFTKVRAQAFSYSIRASFIKMDISEHDREIVLAPKDYSNGFEIGPLVTYRPKPSIFAFTTGVIFTSMKYDDTYRKYNLSFFNTPLQFSIEMGKKGGAFLGFGIRFWYLLNVPEDLEFYEEYDRLNRFLFSWTFHAGAFFTIGKTRFQLYPQIESIKTPLYSEKESSFPGHWATHNYYISMVSYILTVSF